MNKNRNVKKAGLVGVSAIMAVTLGIGGVHLIGNAAGNKKLAAIEEQARIENITINNKKKDEMAKVDEEKQLFKEEAVYVYADASGKVNHITVTDWLKNAGIQTALKDVSELLDITNVKGEETFTSGSNHELTWQTNHADIYYQGTTDKEVPIKVNIVYRLDGTVMTPEQLKGKSGKLEMQVSYENNAKEMIKVNGEKEEIYTPFVMATAAIFSGEHFSNVTVENGKLVSDGDRNIVIGFGAPGLKESLDLGEDLDITIPDGFTVTAQVTDFEMNATVTLASSDLLKEIGFDNIESFDDLQTSMEELSDASLQLVDGTKDLADGVKKLKDKTGDFTEGMNTLVSGLSQLSTGAATLKTGIESYTEGTDTLTDGMKEYVDGTTTLANGVTSYTKGTEALADGIKKLNKSAKVFPEKLDTLATGISTLNTGINTLLAEENMNSFETGANALVGGLDSVHTGLTQVEAGVQQVNASLSQLEESFQKNEASIKSLEAIRDSLEEGTAKEQLEATIANLKVLTETQKQSIAGLEAATGETEKLQTGIAALVKTTADNGALKEGAKSLQAGILKFVAGSKNVKTALPTLESGAKELATASKGLPNATKQLKEGAEQLIANNTKLDQGAKTLKKSGKTLKTGGVTLSKNSKALRKGVLGIETALGKLEIGGTKLEHGSVQLSEGIGTLLNGANDLQEGMTEFDETGIQKLTDVLQEDLEAVIKRAQKISKVGENYKSFSGRENSMDGSVKFIVKTEEIK